MEIEKPSPVILNPHSKKKPGRKKKEETNNVNWEMGESFQLPKRTTNYTKKKHETNDKYFVEDNKKHKIPKIYNDHDDILLYKQDTEEIHPSQNPSDPNYKKAKNIMTDYPHDVQSMSFEEKPLEEYLNTWNNSISKSSTFVRAEVIEDIEVRLKNSNIKNANKKKVPTFKEFYQNDENQIDEKEEYEGDPESYKMFRDSILYKEYEMYEKLANRGRETLTKQKNVQYNPGNLEGVDKKYCEDFLREGRANFGERNCRYGRECIFMRLCIKFPDTIGRITETASSSSDAFICREFLLPKDLKAYKDTGALPGAVKPCLGCNRLRTTYYVKLHEKNSEQPIEHLQDHYNITVKYHEQSNGFSYNIANCIMPAYNGTWNGISQPIIEFRANDYVYSHVEKPIDFKGKNTRELRCVVENNLGF